MLFDCLWGNGNTFWDELMASLVLGAFTCCIIQETTGHPSEKDLSALIVLYLV